MSRQQSMADLETRIKALEGKQGAGSHKVDLREQGPTLGSITQMVTDQIVQGTPGVDQGSIKVFADHCEYTVVADTQGAEDTTFSVGYEVDDQGKVVLGQPVKMEMAPAAESLRRYGLTRDTGTALLEAAETLCPGAGTEGLGAFLQGRERSGGDLVDSFRRLGLSESAARQAAKGRR